jgi:N-acetylmuramoyl-L-alanine amidase
LTERRSRGTGNVPPRRRPERSASSESPRPFPELSRHLRGTGEVYSPNSETWLRQPSSRTASAGAAGSTGGARSGAPARVPPRTRRKRRRRRGGASAAKVGSLLLACVVLVGFGVERLRVDGGDPSVTPTPTPAKSALIAASPDTPTDTAVPTSPPTRTPPPTETPTPKPTWTPSPTPTPDPRFIGKVICLDPGHGGSDRGGQRPGDAAAPAMDEATYTLLWARALQLRLEADGFTVVMTRTQDVDVNASGRDVNGDGDTGKNVKDPDLALHAKMTDELQARIDICNDANASLLVSMHINYFKDPKAEGYETWFSGVRNDADASKLFAEIMDEELGKQYAAAGYNATNRGANDDTYAQADPGHGGFKHYLMIGPSQENKVTPSAMPGAIVEVGFLSNDDDAAFMISNAGRNAIVTAYEQAIARYFITISKEFVYGAK